MPAKRKSVRERPRDVIGNAVHIGRIAVGELPNDIRPEERMQAKLLMEAQSDFEAREAELEAAQHAGGIDADRPDTYHRENTEPHGVLMRDDDRLGSLRGHAVYQVAPAFGEFAALLQQPPAEVAHRLASHFDRDSDQARFLRTMVDETPDHAWETPEPRKTHWRQYDTQFGFRGHHGRPALRNSLATIADTLNTDMTTVVDVAAAEDETARRWFTAAVVQRPDDELINEVYETVRYDYADGPPAGDWYNNFVASEWPDSAVRFIGAADSWADAHAVAFEAGAKTMMFKNRVSGVEKGAHAQVRDQNSNKIARYPDDIAYTRNAMATGALEPALRTAATVAAAMHEAAQSKSGGPAAARKAGVDALRKASWPVHPSLVVAAMHVNPDSKFGEDEREAALDICRTELDLAAGRRAVNIEMIAPDIPRPAAKRGGYTR